VQSSARRYCCLAEVRSEMFDRNGASIFGAIEQRVEQRVEKCAA